MTLEPNPNLFPKDGRTFKDTDGTLHTGETWDELIEIVRKYRERNRRPSGNIRREVFDQFCSRHSSMCRPVDPVDAPVRRRGATFQNRVLLRLAALIALKRLNDRPLMDESEVNRRQQVCAKCSQKRGLEINCVSCLHSLKVARKVLIGKRKTSVSLTGFCSELNEDLSITSFLDLEAERNPNLPEGCWRKAP